MSGKKCETKADSSRSSRMQRNILPVATADIVPVPNVEHNLHQDKC